MSRYDTPDSPEGRNERNAEDGVLENLLGIKTISEIEEMETALLIGMKEWSIENIEDDTRFTAALILEMHGGG